MKKTSNKGSLAKELFRRNLGVTYLPLLKVLSNLSVAAQNSDGLSLVKNIYKPKQPSVTKRIARIGLNTGVANLKIRTFTNLRIVTD